MRRVQARIAATRKSLALAFVMSLTLAGAVGIAVYNLDKAYVATKFDLVTYVPDRLTAGADTSILVMCMDREGNPMPGRNVELKLKTNDSTRTVWSGCTDEDGTVAPVFPVPDESGKIDIIAVSGEEELVTSSVVDDSVRIIITTDKPIYQPGQTMHIRLLSYAGANPLPSTDPLLLEIIDPNGDKILKKLLTANEFGIASYDLGLSGQIIQGTYTVKASSGEREVTRAVIVKEYVLPKFRVGLLGFKDWYSVNDQISGFVDAEYFFGKEVSGSVSVDASVYYGVWTKIYSAQGTLTYGQYAFSMGSVNYAVGIPAARGNGYLQLNVSVTDTGGHTEMRSKVIPIAKTYVTLSILTDSCVMGQQSVFSAIARTPDGKAISNYTIMMSTRDTDGHTVLSNSSKTDSRGVATFAFSYTGEHDAVFYTYSQYSEGAVTVNLGDGTGVKVIPDKSSYSVGETGVFTVRYSGQSMTTNVYYDVVSRGFVVDRGVVKLSHGSAELRVAMVPEMEPFAQVRMYKIESNMNTVRDAVTFSVGSGDDINISVSSGNQSYSPRDDVPIDFSVQEGGNGVFAALGVSIVDEAVYETSLMFQGFEQLVFGLDQEFMVPQYQILSYVYSGSGILPSESGQVVSELDKARMSGTGDKTNAEIEAMMSEAVTDFWYSMFLIVGIGIVGLAAFSVRKAGRFGGSRRRSGAKILLAIVAIVAVGSLVLAGMYVMTLGYGASSGAPNQTPTRWDAFGLPDGLQPKGAGGPGFDFDGAFADESPIGAIGFGDASAPTIVRNYFPETWYWNPCLLTDENGSANVTLQAPDSITSWKADVIASTMDGHIGTQTASITVFQPFFIDPDIPVSVVRNDTFQLKVQVYNYLASTQQVTVTLDPEPWFNRLSAGSQAVEVPGDYVTYVTFTIQATKAGWHTITLEGIAGNVSDAVVKPIHVVPDGTKVETLFNGQVENSTSEHSLWLDPRRIEGGETSWVKIQGGVEAVLLDGVEAYIGFVTGCGEQSLSMLSIDILAYDTVTKLGTAAPEKMFEYETMVNQGIQHELTYLVDAKNEEGRGIVWFPGDQDVHPWLTSWGLIAFQDAINAGFGLDEKIVKDMQQWLMSIQEGDGSWAFPEWGIYEFNNPILKSKKIASTAYIARALLYSGVSPSDEHIQKAVDYLEANAGSVTTDAYSAALVLIVLQQAGGSATLRSQLAAALDSMKKETNGTYYWSSSTNMISDNGGDPIATDMWGGYSSTRVIETTGYAAIALHGDGGYEGAVNGAVKYLLNHRQSLGGWYSTQDTIVAFHTLASVADNTIRNVTVDVAVNGAPVFSVQMGEFNKDVTYYVDLRPYLTQDTDVTVKANGTGSILYSVYLAQYVPWPSEPKSSPYMTLEVTYDATHIQVTDSITAHMYLLYNGVAPSLQMILVDLRAPMGFAFNLSEFDALVAGGLIASWDSTERQVLVYLTNVVSGTPIEFDYSLVAQMPIKSTVQDICAWDMYDPNNTRADTLPVQFEAS